MIRWLSILAMLVGVSCAQDPTSSTPTAGIQRADTGTNSASARPNAIGSGEQVRTPALDIPPLPTGTTSLLGGTIHTVDLVRDRLVIQAFGGSSVAVLFDERTRVFRDGKAASLAELKTGERAYVDTTLDGTDVFARNIRIAPAGPTGQSKGQIVDFRPGTGELRVRDTLAPEPVEMRLAADAVLLHGDHHAQPAELRPGTLVNLAFTPGGDDVPIVRQVSILASPGATFAVSGRIEHLDLHRGLLVVKVEGNTTYEVYVDPKDRSLTRDLRQGADVTIRATFDGTRYQGRDIAVNSGSTK